MQSSVTGTKLNSLQAVGEFFNTLFPKHPEYIENILAHAEPERVISFVRGLTVMETFKVSRGYRVPVQLNIWTNTRPTSFPQLFIEFEIPQFEQIFKNVLTLVLSVEVKRRWIVWSLRCKQMWSDALLPASWLNCKNISDHHDVHCWTNIVVWWMKLVTFAVNLNALTNLRIWW